MATAYDPPVKKPRRFPAKPRPELDRDAIRNDIAERYENTLRYLGR